MTGIHTHRPPATVTRAATRSPSLRRRHRIGNLVATTTAAAIGAVFLVPFLWMLSSSLKDLSEIYQFPPRLIPTEIRWSNYPDAWNALPFAGLRYPGRDTLFLAYLATMMIPFPVLMVPLFVIMRNLHLVDSLWSLILPAIFTPAGTFLMRQFILTL